MSAYDHHRLVRKVYHNDPNPPVVLRQSSPERERFFQYMETNHFDNALDHYLTIVEKNEQTVRSDKAEFREYLNARFWYYKKMRVRTMQRRSSVSSF